MASQATQADSPNSGVVTEILDVSCSVQWQAYVLYTVFIRLSGPGDY